MHEPQDDYRDPIDRALDAGDEPPLAPEPEPEVPTRSEYWAATDDEEELGQELVDRVNAYDRYIEEKGLLAAWKRSYRQWFGLGDDDGSGRGFGEGVMFGGVQGELTLVDANHYRNLGQHLKTLTIQNRPTMEARATNTDPESVAQTHIARGVLEYYHREERLEEKLEQCLELSLICGEAFGVTTWDATAGQSDRETGEPLGDLRTRVYAPSDTIRDWRRPPVDQQWYIVRDYVNRYDLAANYEDRADEILALGDDGKRIDDLDVAEEASRDDGTYIPVYWFYHAQSPALPNGRYAFFLADGTILHKDSLPYDSLPVYRCAPSELLGSAFGFSNLWGLLGLNQVYNALLSTLSSCYDAFGLQDVICEKGTDPPTRIGRLNVWRIPKGAMAPQGVNFTEPPAGALDFLQFLTQLMELLSGVNAVARGNTESIGKAASGAHLALIQTMAVQFNGALQASFARLIEDSGTAIINILKRYADRPRIAMIAGRDNRHYMRAYTNKDIAKVSRVVCDVGNPMRNTHAGRVEIVKLLTETAQASGMDMSEITIGKLIQVLQTGNLELLMGPLQRQYDLMDSENATLLEGPPIQDTQLAGPDGQLVPVKQVVGVPALKIDDHARHIAHHGSVLSSPEARQNPQIVAAVLAHIQEHQFLQASQGAMAAGPPMPANDNAGPGSMGPANDNGALDQMQGRPGPAASQLPSGPKNPLTGEQVPVAADAMGGGQ